MRLLASCIRRRVMIPSMFRSGTAPAAVLATSLLCPASAPSHPCTRHDMPSLQSRTEHSRELLWGMGESDAAEPVRVIRESPAGASAHDEGVRWLGVGEALERARRTGRPVLVSIVTHWCGWCRKMERDTYGNAAIRDTLAARFELARLDAESDGTHMVRGTEVTERELAVDLGVRSYPATAFLTPDATLLTVVPGYIAPGTFRHVLTYMAEGLYRSIPWKDYFEAHGGS